MSHESKLMDLNEVDKALESSLAKRIAAIMLSGGTVALASKNLGVSKRVINQILLTPEYQMVVTQAGDEALYNAKTYIKKEMANLSVRMMQVIRDSLAEGSLEAVKIGLKVLGFDNEERQESNTNIQVVLPGGTEKVFEVSNEEEKK